MIGVMDINQSSQSDVGLSGSFVPFVKTYDGYYFTPEVEKCSGKYNLDKALKEVEGINIPYDTSTFENYIKSIEDKGWLNKEAAYDLIKIVEKVE
jgi:hypothetical protein